MAQIESGSDEQIIIKSLVESYGLIFSPTRMSGGIGAINCLQKLLDKYGFHFLERAIRLCVITWEGDPLSLSANMLNARQREPALQEHVDRIVSRDDRQDDWGKNIFLQRQKRCFLTSAGRIFSPQITLEIQAENGLM